MLEFGKLIHGISLLVPFIINFLHFTVIISVLCIEPVVCIAGIKY